MIVVLEVLQHDVCLKCDPTRHAAKASPSGSCQIDAFKIRIGYESSVIPIDICSEWKNLHKAVLAWVHSLKTLEVTVDKNIRKKINTAKTTEDMYVILKLYWHVIDLSIETTVHSECICSRKPWTNMLQSWKVF